MPQICKVCIHPNRDAIDAELSRDWERSLRAMAEEYGVSKDSLFRHEARHLPAAEYLNNQEKSKAEEAELRQVCEIDEQKKETEEARQVEPVEQEKGPAPDAEVQYRAFIERWRGRMAVGRDELTEWPFDDEELKELIETAVSRGDLWQLGKFYGATVQTLVRFQERA